MGIAISAPEDDVLALISEQYLTFPNIYDTEGAASALYEITGVPNYFFLDKDLRIASDIRGAPGSTETIRDRLLELQREQ